MWDLLARLLDNQKAITLTRGAILAFSMVGIITLPVIGIFAKAACDEFQGARADIKTILATTNGMTATLEVTAERDINR